MFYFHFLLSLTFLFQSPSSFSSAVVLIHPPPSDALALLTFKSKSDLDNKLQFSFTKRFDHCHWEGVKCVQGRVVRLLLQGFGLRGVFEPNTLSRLDQLRVLSLHNNSLTGPIPDLSELINLKTLFLHHNSFTGFFPPSILSLHRLRTLDLSYNKLTGPIPDGLTRLDRLFYLRLDWNRFNGSLPSFNQSFLQIFNVSGNNLTGSVPVTPTLSRFDISSFSWNPSLCGEIIHKDCGSRVPFFEPWEEAAPPTVGQSQSQSQSQTEQLRGLALSPPSPKKHNKTALILGFSVAILLVIGSLLSVLVAIKKRRKQRVSMPPTGASDPTSVIRTEEEKELDAKVKKSKVVKSGSLVFCGGEAQVYTLEQLMRGSAELLGRGSMGTTYKAVLDNQLVVTVKRLDSSKTAIRSKEMFERHIELVGRLRHPNLVPLRAFFQAKEERLIIYEYQSNGSLFSLIHGSRSTRAKPLHWTSCLKIAEDVAQGIAYIHQESNLVHGNLKSSNVLLGDDFEACLTDYCLTVFVDASFHWEKDYDSTGYKAPETTRRSGNLATIKSDVYSFGVLLMELLTSKPPSQHPFLMPMDLLNWVRDTREGEEGNDNWLSKLVAIAVACSQTSPEQRPTMWQVLRMIQEIKETVMTELDSSRVFS